MKSSSIPPKITNPITKAALFIVVPMLYSASFTLFDFPLAFEGPLINKFQISAVKLPPSTPSTPPPPSRSTS